MIKPILEYYVNRKRTIYTRLVLKAPPLDKYKYEQKDGILLPILVAGVPWTAMNLIETLKIIR